MTVEGEDAFCVDINTNFRNGYKTRADASTRMSYDQISDVALSIEYVNQYVQSHSGLSSQHIRTMPRWSLSILLPTPWQTPTTEGQMWNGTSRQTTLY